MKAKTIIKLLLMAALILTFLPTVALADTGYSYIDEDGTAKTTGALTVTPILTNTATLSSGWYVVNADVTRTGTITASGDAKLILVDGKTLTVTASSDNAGIVVTGSNRLTIYGQTGGTGTLDSTGSNYCAGIGGAQYNTVGTITINSGTVNAYGGREAAAIGSGSFANGGTITINGGTVNATGRDNGSGIGSGWLNDDGGTITINGGTVNAQGDSAGAGIGSGYFGDGGTITINDGTVDATGGYYGAGIGGGDKGDGGNITITGGTIKATGGDYASGIGGGSGGVGGNITITGGTVTAAGSGSADWGGAGIGGGFDKGGGNITISGGVVTATGRKCGAGIGGSGGGSAGIITISGGIVTAEGDDYVHGGSPGIGNGAFGDGGTIILSGGVVFAKAGPKANDIGKGGASNSFDSLEISKTAAVFLYTKSCVTPTTTTHTNNAFSGHIANAAAYGIPVPWSGNFGAYLRLQTLSYNANKGSGTAPSQVTRHIGTSVSVAGSGTLSRVGYTFSGWNTAANKEGSGYNVGGTFTFLDDTTLYAAWTPNTYTVKYNANGGTGSTASSSHTYDEAKPLTPNGFTKTGYTFVGWTTEAGGTVAYSNGQSVTNLTTTNGATVTLYAVWTPHTYMVSYNANGGTGNTDSRTHTYDEAKALTPNSFTRTGYTFVGWTTEAGGKVAYADEESVFNLTPKDGATVILYAVWTPHTYTVSYDANGGSGSTDSSIHTYDETKKFTPNSFTRTGYTFAGWTTEADGKVAYTDEESVLNLTPEDGATVTLYAVWTPHTYMVSYNANGGTGSTDSSSHTYDEAKTLTANGFAKTGYTFAGWTTSAGGTVVYSEEQNVSNLTSEDSATVILYAVWRPHTYTVEYHANGGTGTTASSSHTYDESKTLTTNGFARTGYTFMGWAASAGGTVVYADEESLSNLTSVNGATVTLYAVWTPHTYAVSYDANGGTGSTDSSSHTYDEAKTLTANGFTRAGYTFAGWATEVGGEVIYADEENVVSLTPEDDATVTLCAVWAPHIYTVSYNANGGMGRIESSSHAYDAAKALTPNRFAKTGYTFAGWATSPDGEDVYTDEESVLNLESEEGAMVTLYAVWTPNSYTVSYNANGGLGIIASSSHTYDVAKMLTANGFKRTGYTFLGWATSSNGAVIYRNEESVSNLTSENDETVTLYAVWKGNSYTMNYDANGGMGNVASSRHTYGAVKALTANGFILPGYVFSGWATSPDGAAVYSDEQDIMNLTSINGTTVTLYAVWTPVYSLSVVGGTGSGSYAATTRVSIAADEAPSGKVFARWISSNGGTFDDATHVSTTFTMPDQDVIVTATYRDVAILPTPSAPPPWKLKPASIQVDEATGSMLISIDMASLPEGTTAIKLPSGEIISIDANARVLKLQLSQNEWEKYEHLVLVALNDEHIPLGSYVIDLSEETWQQIGTAESSSGFMSMLTWIAVGVLAIGGMITAIFIFLSKKK